MGGMFDFNNDGKTDSGEHFIGYQIFKDTTKGSSGSRRGHKIDGFDVVIIVAVIWGILNLISKILY